MLKRVKSFVESTKFNNLLCDIFGNVDFYYINFIFDEMEQTKDVRIRVFLKDKKIGGFNLIEFLSKHEELEKSILFFSNMRKYGEIILPSYSLEVHYTKDNILNGEEDYEDDFWDDYPKVIFQSDVDYGLRELTLKAEEEKEEVILYIHFKKGEKNKENSFFEIEGKIRFIEGNYQPLSFKTRENLNTVIPRDSKILLANLSNKAYGLFGVEVPHENVVALEGEFEDFLNNLRIYTNKDSVEEAFKNLTKDSFKYSIKINLFYSDDVGLEVRYYIEGYNFNWNNINRNTLESKGKINSSSYMLDGCEMDYLNRTFYHTNNILSDRVNVYSDILLERLDSCINFEEQLKFGRRHFSTILNTGKIINNKIVGDYVYLLNEAGDVVSVLKRKDIKDLDLCVEFFNNVIEAVS